MEEGDVTKDVKNEPEEDESPRVNLECVVNCDAEDDDDDDDALQQVTDDEAPTTLLPFTEVLVKEEPQDDIEGNTSGDIQNWSTSMVKAELKDELTTEEHSLEEDDSIFGIETFPSAHCITEYQSDAGGSQSNICPRASLCPTTTDKICSDTPLTFDSFQPSSNLLTYHLVHQTEETPYNCEICVSPRMGSCHTETESNYAPLKVDAIQQTKYSILSRLLVQQTEEKSYKCDICDKTFSERFNLTIHRSIHTGETPYKCETCKKRFAQNNDLKIHQRIHAEEPPYKCETCGKCFLYPSHLMLHQRLHTGERPYQCQICSKCFSLRATLVDHLRIHTGEKPYKCETCGNCFYRSSQLTTHIRRHTGEKPYKCVTCDKRFSQRCYLKRHLLKHSEENS